MSPDYGLFSLLSKQCQKQDKKSEVQLSLMYLLMLLALADWLQFCLVLEASALGLTIDLAIGGMESMNKEVAIDFFRCFLWKVMTSLQSY